jgi:hypothetical protein
MQSTEEELSRPEILVAGVIYLMTHYVRSRCPRLAVCISRHMQCLATHPEAPPVVRDICAGLHGTWGEAASAAGRHAPVH